MVGDMTASVSELPNSAPSYPPGERQQKLPREDMPRLRVAKPSGSQGVGFYHSALNVPRVGGENKTLQQSTPNVSTIEKSSFSSVGDRTCIGN